MSIQTVNASASSNRRLGPRSLQGARATRSVKAWVRPTEWPALPAITSADEKFVGLVSVADTPANRLAIYAAGNYTVDWGDGTVENFASGVQAEHQYSYSNPNLTSTSYGYKCAIVTLTPQAGQQLTSLKLNRRHADNVQTVSIPWLDVAISLPNCSATGLAIGASNSSAPMGLKQARILNSGGCTDFSYLFCSCNALESVQIQGAPLVTNMAYMFYECFSLQEAPSFDTSAATNMANMFQSCYSLRSVPLLKTSLAQNLSSMFSTCYSLESVPLLNTSSATNMSYMFQYCYSLESVPLLNTSAATNLSSMFSYCYSLESVPTFNTSSATNMSYMFQYCYSLQSAPQLNTGAATNLRELFSYCYSLKGVPALNTASATNVSGMFNNCRSLESVPFLNTSSATDMNTLFYNCRSLTSIPLLDTSKALNLQSFATHCVKLKDVPLLNTSAVTNVDSCFYGCYALERIPALNLSSVTVANGFAYICGSLASIEATGLKRSVGIHYSGIGKAGIEDFFGRLGKAYDTTQSVNVSGCTGADSISSKASCGTTTGSTVVTMSNTYSLATGMICTGTGVSTGVSVTFQDSGDTVTRAAHGLANGTMISFSAITSTTGIATYTNYWVVNATADTFQVAATQGGDVLALTTDGSGTLLYPAYVTAINPNVSVTLSAPASATGTVTLGFRKLDTFKATSKGWVVSG